MKTEELTDYVENFRRRVLADALQEATANYWNRRAETLQAAMPREGDFVGLASPELIEAQKMRLAEAVLACRYRAVVSLGGGLE